MKLIDQVYKSINEYPTLFWTGDFETSRILVLDHIFLVAGNGFAWTPDGYLVQIPLGQDDDSMEFVFDWPAGWKATKAPAYGELTYANRNLPTTPRVTNFASRRPYQQEPDYVPDNIQADYRDGLNDVLAWANSTQEQPLNGRAGDFLTEPAVEQAIGLEEQPQ